MHAYIHRYGQCYLLCFLFSYEVFLAGLICFILSNWQDCED
jgi:hypothetical protein